MTQGILRGLWRERRRGHVEGLKDGSFHKGRERHRRQRLDQVGSGHEHLAVQKKTSVENSQLVLVGKH